MLNHTEFQDVDRTARFDPAGNQINPNFGTPIGIAHADTAAADDSAVGEVCFLKGFIDFTVKG